MQRGPTLKQGGMMRTKLLTQEQVQEWFNVPIRTLEDMRSRPSKDPIPFVKVGRLVRYREDEIEKWIQRNTFFDTHEAKTKRVR